MKTEITKNIRIINYGIDSFLSTTLSICISLPVQYILLALPSPEVIGVVCFFLYYIVLEWSTGQTIGKKITKTIVVDAYGSKPSFFKILCRTLLRLNPLDSFSYMFGQEQGTHDVLSRTRLISVNARHIMEKKQHCKV